MSNQDKYNIYSNMYIPQNGMPGNDMNNTSESGAKGNEIEIDLRGLAVAILDKIVLIILISILVAGLAFIYSEFFITEQYTSSTQVYILTSDAAGTDGVFTSSDITFATYIADDYTELLTSEMVLNQVIDELNLETTTTTLADMITVTRIEDTRILTIEVTNSSAERAKNIADTVREVANKTLSDVMDGLEPVRAVDEANLPTSPSSPNVRRNTLIGFLIGCAASIIIVCISFILDDTIKKPEDIEKYLGISVLGCIPLKSSTESQGYGYGYGYGERQRKVQDKGSGDDDDTSGSGDSVHK